MPERATMGTKEAAKELKLKQATISKYCREGKMLGATQDAEGSPWQIPLETIELEKKARGLK